MAGHREFDSGATRDTENGKPDYEGALSPIALERFAQYMLKHCNTSHGKRSTDNWTKGIPRRQYVKSLLRHNMDVWLITRGWAAKATTQDLGDALCAVLFNAQGLLHEVLLGRDISEDTPTKTRS